MKRSTALKLKVVGLVFIFLMPAGSLMSAENPAYYLKKKSWQETMLASRQAIMEFEAQKADRQARRLKELGIKLGPWYSVGPFTGEGIDPFNAEFGPELDTDLNKTYKNGKFKWTKRPEWKDGMVHKLPGDRSSGEALVAANYLFRKINSNMQGVLSVYLGSNDGIQVWLNGKKVHANNIGRQAGPDQDIIKVNFKKGENHLLMKINNRAANHAFYFSMHPGGKTQAKTIEELWKLVERDFTSPKQKQQIRWEREDKIWQKDFKVNDFQALSNRYAQAATNVETFAKQARELAGNVKHRDDLQKVREVYYLSQFHSDQITRVRQKVKLMKNQLQYQSNKFPQKASQWRKYKDKLQVLEASAKKVMASAAKGDSKAFGKLTQIEGELETTHRQQPQAPPGPKQPYCYPFNLKQVRLLDGPFKKNMERDRKYLYDLDSDRLLHMFRVTAGQPSTAKPLGGWEARELRGHTMGHYLSACALLYASTGDEKIKAKADNIVAELAKCQNVFGNGYLSAFPEEGIKNIIYGTGGWWAPWYTLHKIYAGLIDMYNHCGNQQALEVAVKMAAWAKGHLDNLTEEQTQQMLDTEYGGMNEVFCNLYAVTRNPDHLELARKFDHKRIFDPLANFEDRLKGLHVNTQIPKIIGTAREYELTGEQYYYRIATFFWDQVVNARSYCTGGTSNDEHWHSEPYKLANELSVASQESCCTYNMLKLTRHLFTWQPNAEYADYYERALFNSILSTQDPKTGMMMYFVPLNSGHWKVFNTPNDSFWCCTGTGLENHVKYGDSIYFYNDEELYVNLFIASELNWDDKGLKIIQQTNFPEQEGTSLIIETGKTVELVINIRIPYWAVKPAIVKINGKRQKTNARPGSYLKLKRKWKDGDRIDVDMQMSLHLDRMPDDRNLAAIMYGPLVLAGELGTEGLPEKIYLKGQLDHGATPEYPPVPEFYVESDDINSWIKPVEGKPLTFKTIGAGKPKDVTLIPYHKLFNQRYAIYWRLNPKSK
ncbi:MAG: glycoside hydrolase family 127 protein [Planctomycetota bacterium]|jgi:DUF1680 family protein